MNLRKFLNSTLAICLSFLFAYILVGFNNKKNPDSPLKNQSLIDILHYTISLEIPDISSKEIKGITDIQMVSLTDSLKKIELDLLSMTVDSVWIDDEPIERYSYDNKKLIIPTNTPLNKGLTSIVTIFYHGSPNKDPLWGGFYFSRDEAYNMGIGMKSFPHPMGRTWFPCVDNYTDKATYDYFITVDSKYNAICGGSLKEVILNNNGTRTYHWHLQDPISTYLSSVNIGDYIILYTFYKSIYRNIPVEICVNPKDTTNALKSLSRINDYLYVFESLFGPYNWEKIGFTSVSFTGGAMEHATNIAIPSNSLDGTFKFESLFTHEIAHSWFGNLVTCSEAKDIWLNEGWASYCEAIFEEFAYGENAYKKYVRANHKEVLRIAHIRDKGFRSVYNLPPEYTYGTTVYTKGSDIVHTLRGYLGDHLFFNAIKEYFKEYAFSDISVLEFKDFLSKQTQVDLNNFFNSWVFTAGFPHFSIDSFTIKNSDFEKEVTTYVRQKLKGRNEYTYSNKLEITFIDQYWNKQTEIINVSGKLSYKNFKIPFTPIYVGLDMEEKVSDATTDNYKIIKNTGEYLYDKTYFTVNVIEISDSAFIRAVHNWVAPDSFKKPVNGLFLSKSRYWKIDGIIPEKFHAKGVFYYNGSETSPNGWLDHTLISNYTDSLVLLYRPGTNYDWGITDFKKIGNNTSGLLIADTLKKGEYAMAIKDWSRFQKIKK